MSISGQNTSLPFLGADLRPSQPERRQPPDLPSLTALGVLSIAALYRLDPETTLQLAADNCNAHWDDVERKKAARAVLEQELTESVAGREQPSAELEGLRHRAASAS